MIYFIINSFISVSFFLIAFYYDGTVRTDKNEHLKNIMMLIATGSLMAAFSLFLALLGKGHLVRIFASLMYFCFSGVSVQFVLLCMRFPNKKKTFVHKTFDLLCIVLLAYLLIYKFQNISINLETGFLVTGATASVGQLSWFKLHNFIFYTVLPLFGLMTLILNIDSIRAKLLKQQVLMIFVGVGVYFLAKYLLNLAQENISPMFNTLWNLVFACFIAVLYKAMTLSKLYDLKMIVTYSVYFVNSYLLQGILAGLAFALLLPLKAQNPSLFYGLFVISVTAIITISYYLTKIIKKKKHQYDLVSTSALEDDLASLDYSLGTEEVAGKFVQIMKEHLDTQFVSILIEDEEDKELKTIYSSHDADFSIPLSNPIFEFVQKVNHPVVIKSTMEKHSILSNVKKNFEDLFGRTGSEVFILLHEGRHVFGCILLGQKRLGNVYTEAEYKDFLKLYSYFFVLGYYMKNIAKESIVGTVNRELQYSGQIIQSIQENFDKIESDKIELGYFSKPAHELGGEFVDIVRLTDDQYLFVLGDMSGKGINASMSMVILKSVIRTFLTETTDFKELVNKVNKFIRFNLPRGTFFAGFFGILDLNENALYYLNCGIPALFMYNHVYNNVIEIQGDGKILGFARDIEKLIKIKKVKMAPGDILFVCTDGLIDSQSLRGEPFGKGRVQTLLLENIMYPSEKIPSFLYTSLKEFVSKEIEEDVSMLVIKFLGR